VQADPIVILTRELEDNLVLVERLGARDIFTLQYPCIKTTLQPFGSESHLPPTMQLEDFHVIVFTSKRGVAGMSSAYSQLAHSSQKIAAVGHATAAAVAEAIHRQPDYIAQPATSEQLANLLAAQLETNQRILHVRGNKSTGTFRKILVDNGFEVTQLEVYRNESPSLNPLFPFDDAVVVMASPSAGQRFFKANNKETITHPWTYLAIGPTTHRYLEKQGLPNIVKAKSSLLDDLCQEIHRLVKDNRKKIVR
jgi:uroporphyrinogen-III synthase